MTRKGFFAAISAAVLGVFVPRPARAHVYSNFKTGQIDPSLIGAKCFVDGIKIDKVWFVDTKAGIVKSYDYMGNGKMSASREGYRTYAKDAEGRIIPILPPIREEFSWFDGSPVEDAGGILSITLQGRIELFAKDGTRIY